MKLGEIIRNYRNEHSLSLREFSQISGISNSYISMLESGRHPRSGRPIVPTITKLNQLSSAMGLKIDDLLSIMDDMPVDIDGNAGIVPDLNLSECERNLIIRFRQLSSSERSMILRSVGISE